MKIARFTSLVLIILFSFACAPKYVYQQDELIPIISERLGMKSEDAVKLIPFLPSDKIREIAKIVKTTYSTPKAQMNLILSMIVGKNTLNVIYEHNSNFTAYQVTIQQSANCIAFTNLFVAIAREVGLKAVFVDVTQRITYEVDEFFNYQEGHICAGIVLPYKTYLVDFIYDSKEYKKYRILSDLEAIGNFLTMLGVDKDKEYLKTGNPELKKMAIYYHTAALSLAPNLTRAMNNLAVIYLRDKKYEKAEELLERALGQEGEISIIQFNLAELYLRQGDVKKATKLLLKNIGESIGEPYTYYRLGQIYFSQKKLTLAEYYLGRAIDLKQNFLDPRISLISLLIVLNRDEEAQELIQDSLKVFPGNKKLQAFEDMINNRGVEIQPEEFQ